MRLPASLSCPACAAVDVRSERTLDGHRLVRCTTCSFVFVWPRPSRDDNRTSYARGERGALPGALPAGSTEQLLAAYGAEFTPYVQYALTARLLHLARLRPIRRMLDFGCGSGHLLHLARRVLGCEIFGVEVDPVGRAGAKRFGFELHEGALEEVPFPQEFFDLVYAAQIFEHLPEPRRELLELRRLLASGGLLFIEAPNYGSISIRLGRDAFLHNRPPGHLNYFRPASLRRLLGSSGFEVVSLRTSGLNYRDLLGLRRNATRSPAPHSDAHDAGTTIRRDDARDLPLARRRIWKLQALRVLDSTLSIPGWGMQNEGIARKSP
jgi:SAM-dependent methyltransferase